MLNEPPAITEQPPSHLDPLRWRRRRNLPDAPTRAATATWWYAVSTFDTLAGDRLRVLLVVDEHARSCRSITVSHDLTERDVRATFDELARMLDTPRQIVTLAAPPFIIDAAGRWAVERGAASLPAPASNADGTFARSILTDVQHRMLRTTIVSIEHAQAITRDLVTSDAPQPVDPRPLHSTITTTPIQEQAAPDWNSTPASSAGPVTRWSIRLVVASSIVLLVVLGLGPLTGRYRTSPILANSMSPTYRVGDVVLLRPVPPSRVHAGDVIQFSSPENVRELITHRVIEIRSGNPNPSFVTKGDANRAEDPWVIKIEQDSAWLVRGHVPWVGWIVRAFTSTAGIVLLAASLSALLLMLAFQLLRRT